VRQRQCPEARTPRLASPQGQREQTAHSHQNTPNTATHNTLPCERQWVGRTLIRQARGCTNAAQRLRVGVSGEACNIKPMNTQRGVVAQHLNRSHRQLSATTQRMAHIILTAALLCTSHQLEVWCYTPGAHIVVLRWVSQTPNHHNCSTMAKAITIHVFFAPITVLSPDDAGEHAGAIVEGKAHWQHTLSHTCTPGDAHAPHAHKAPAHSSVPYLMMTFQQCRQLLRPPCSGRSGVHINSGCCERRESCSAVAPERHTASHVSAPTPQHHYRIKPAYPQHTCPARTQYKGWRPQ